MSNSSSLTLTWQQALSGHANQVKLPLQPIIVKDLSRKKCSTLTAYQSLSSSSTPGGTWSIRCCSLTHRSLTKEHVKISEKLLQKSFSQNDSLCKNLKKSYLQNDNLHPINPSMCNHEAKDTCVRSESHALHLGSL